MDCLGCSSCSNVCPTQSLEMKTLTDDLKAEQKYFDFAVSVEPKQEVIDKFGVATVKGSQFKMPYLEFSGACAGCGETPYAKLVTQLYGDRMYIANATGCSSIWGNSSPSTPYTIDKNGRGPAWDNSLFEDNAEFGYGMYLAQKTLRDQLKAKVEKLVAEDASVKNAADEYLATYNDTNTNTEAAEALVNALAGSSAADAKDIIKNKDFLAKKSQWIFGGDGWSFDIGFGGLDHVLASGEDVNVFVFNTEVYSNTGGQSSKATPTGAVAQFAAGGKEIKQKDLASIAMSYGYVYVAQVSMGANPAQLVKAIKEAESYNGPSLIIAYAPCINHRIKVGMGKSIAEEKKAVDAGYWNLFRFNPENDDKFSLDSKAATIPYLDFISGEARYTALKKVNSDKADKLFDAAAENAKKRYDYLSGLADLYSKKAD